MRITRKWKLFSNNQPTFPVGFSFLAGFFPISVWEKTELITIKWKSISAVLPLRPQHIVSNENIAKNPPMGDEKYKEKVVISTIDFGRVN